MNIQYLESTITPDCFYVAVDEVVVGCWISTKVENRDVSRWIDCGIYHPIRSHYKSKKWDKTPFDPSLIFDTQMLDYVRQNKKEMPLN